MRPAYTRGMNTRLARPTRALRAGFSLIEMMVTVSMLGILVGMVAPNVSKDISHSRVNGAARVVATDLEQALSIAGRQRRPVRVVFDGSAKEIRLIDRTNGQLISRRALGGLSEYKLYSVAGSPSTVDLLPHGVATASTIVTLSAGGYSRTVTMTRGGHVRVSP